MSATIILGDVHIGKALAHGKPGIGSALNSRLIDQLNILDWVLDISIARMAKRIIITGDIFEETKPHPTMISLFINWLKKCVAHNVNIHIILGNHDILRSGQFLISALDVVISSEIEGVYIYKNIQTIHTPGASFTLMPYRDRRSFNTDSNNVAISLLRDKLPYEVSEIEKNNAKIVIGHFALDGSIPIGDEFDDMTNELFCPLDMFSDYDYVWMGHVHKPQILRKAPYISHIGSMDLSDFTEGNHKKNIVIFDPDSKNIFDYLEIPTRPLRQISISVPENISDSSEFVIHNIKNEYKTLSKSMVRLDVSILDSNTPSIDRKLVEQCLTDLGAFHVCRISEERKINSVNIAKSNDLFIDNTVTEASAIKTYAAINIDKKEADAFIALASSIVDEHNQIKDAK